MDEQDKNRALETQNSGQGMAEQEEEVRATMEQARQAIEASAAETDRAKRLRREIEELPPLPVSSPPGDAGENSGPE